MRTVDFPNTVGIRELRAEEIPAELKWISGNVRSGVDAAVKADSILSDAFVAEGGGFSVKSDSRILSGHFDSMPIVPGVVSKRLAAMALGRDLYASSAFPDGRKSGWKTEFAAPMTVWAKAEFEGNMGDSFRLTESGRTYATFTYGEWDHGSGRKPHDFGATNVKDLYHGFANAVPPDDADKYVLQSAPFRFVTTWGEFEHQPSDWDATFLGWYFDIPSDFAFVDEYGQVPNEIVEETVAQIASFAYAKSRNLPEVRLENGDFNPKAQVLTFKSSVAEAGIRTIHSGDRLSVAIDIVEEEGRVVKFAYEAWNSSHARVLKWMIEGSTVPLKLLKRMVG